MLKVFLTYTDEEFANYYSATGLAALQQHANVVRNTTGRVLRDAELAEAAAGCQVIVAHRSAPGTAATFAAAPDLVAFLRGAVDISTIDVAAASAQGILVTHATAGFSVAVAELGLGMMIDLARGVSRAGAEYRAGRMPAPFKGIQLSSAILGLVGYGAIARRLAALALGIGMRVQVYDPYVTSAEPGVVLSPFREVLATSDFVVCLALSTPETANLFNAEAFAAMRPGTSFINLSRGQLVDDGALEAALDSGHLRGAGLDVGRAPDQMPSPRFTGRSDVVVTPHIGGLTAEAREHQTMDTVRQVAALAQGRMPENAVNADAAHRLSRPKIK
ncbi:NAD(P)-dependent oxidoreductase [Humitalea sp. 24SJ18S-53]|uniref:NAD(P)-dependent oxidoreductase n=1 Tax=Humitalea sp. 24SJ18S-53 TaxID=3422307 RepID=UPI003D67DB76